MSNIVNSNHPKDNILTETVSDMKRDWKTGKPVENSHHEWKDHEWKDLILKDEFGITKNDWDTTIQDTVKHIQDKEKSPLSDRISCIMDLLLPPVETLWQGKVDKLPFRWLPCKSLQGATVADHALTASAIAYCLAYDISPRPDNDTMDKIRLSALTATWKEDGLEEVYDALWENDSPIAAKKNGEEYEHIVFLAKTTASKKQIIKNKSDFDSHPLNQGNSAKIGLVLGGATKIKGYFMESAKLPEIRGASALLDRINLEDTPALFGRKNTEDNKRYDDIRKDFYERTKHELNAPECIIYAAGGNTLAFAPTSVVHYIADEIERIYTKETLVANSAAVGNTFNLLELQYGINPTNFWVEDYRTACKQENTKTVMETYYGSTEEKFFARKCFGELTSKLAGAQMKRREGNITPDRDTRRNLPAHVEIGPYHLRCESCERRPVLIHSENLDKKLCDACARKYVTGRATKKRLKGRQLKTFTDQLQWEPANKSEDGTYLLKDWITLYNDYRRVTSDILISNKEEPDGPSDLSEIAAASDKENYIAFIYADGNNMGNYLENIATPAQYRQFSERVFVTMQKAAFDALADHLTPTKDNVHPFEIVSIGGDDLLIIVPGSKVFEIVKSIGENFDNAFQSKTRLTNQDHLYKSQRYNAKDWANKQKKQPEFSMSLGFVIAEEHTPIAFLEHLAASLLKSAKSKAKTLIKEGVGYRGGTVDFLVLKSISMITSNLGDFRKEFYKAETENSLTMRPFTLHELEGFIKTIEDFKKGKFPRSQLYQLRESLKLGRATSTLDYLYFRSRLDSEDGKRLQNQIEHYWRSASEKHNNSGPWYAIPQESEKDKKCYETLLFDLIEAYDFIPDPEKQIEEDNSDE